MTWWRSWSARISVATASVLISACATQANRADDYPSERFDRLFHNAQQSAEVPGASIGVSVDGNIVWSRAFGMADLELDVPANLNTRFRIGSASKPITATVLGRMVERGEISLDDTVSKYIADAPDAWKSITVRQLASNRSGIRHYKPDEFQNGGRIWWQHFEEVEESLTLFADDPLVQAPGEGFHYSTYGWTLLAAILEKAGRADFPTLLHRDVFQPFQMSQSEIDHHFMIIPNRTRFYWRAPTGQIANAPFTENSYKWAGGGIVSTSEDMLRFGQAWLTGDAVGAELRDLMWSPQGANSKHETAYGLGWFFGLDNTAERFVNARETVPQSLLSMHDAKIEVVEHRGGQMGGSSVLWLFPQFDIVVSAHWNMSGEGRRLYAVTLQIACETIAAQPSAPELICEGA